MTDRLKRYKKGRWAEAISALYLMGKAYRPVAWRYKTHYGEIDLIAVKGDMLVFIEVKARDAYVTGVEAVSPRAQSRIQNAAQDFVAKHSYYIRHLWRFDVMVVIPGRLPYHIKDAWRPV